MNRHALKILEYDKVLALVAEQTTSDLGRKEVLNLKPSIDLEHIRSELGKVSELETILRNGLQFPIRGIKNINTALRRAEIEGSFLEPEQLLDIASVLETSRNICTFMKNWERDSPRLKVLCQSLTILRGIEDRIHGVINEEAEVRDSASHTLSKVRSEKRVIRDRIQHKLNAIINSEFGREALQEPIITLRDDRFVVPVKSNFRGRLKGIIHDESSSGQTVFVEPYRTAELNNQLRKLVLKEKREVERILREATEVVRASVPEIAINLTILQELDTIYAKASFSIEYNCIAPKLNNDCCLCLEGARHPLLEMQFREKEEGEVVPLDIYLNKKINSILITGPNTGGKTVALKTAGLMALMTQSGIHIPAGDHSELPVFTDILADIGDEQSIEQNLSTFSSHLLHIIEILESADENSLVLIDEVGAGTDPDQGAVLGMAILEELVGRGSLTIATTHYSSLKAFAHEAKGIENACMAFDSETLLPTFHLLMGVPGSSKALEIAKRLGMPDHLIKKAANYLGAEEMEISALITDLQEHARVIREKRHSIDTREAQLDRLIQEYTEKERTAKAEARQIKRESIAEADRILRGANSLIERTIRDLRATNAGKLTRKEVKERIKIEQQKIRETLEAMIEPDAKESDETTFSMLSIGQQVKLFSLQKEGIVQKLFEESDEVEVTMGNIRLRVPVSDVAPLEGVEQKETLAGTTSTFASEIGLELDIRGLTFDQAEWEIEKYLDSAQLAGLTRVRLIHGKGTGALRRKVRAFLDDHALVKRHYLAKPFEGGSGATVVEF